MFYLHSFLHSIFYIFFSDQSTKTTLRHRQYDPKNIWPPRKALQTKQFLIYYTFLLWFLQSRVCIIIL